MGLTSNLKKRLTVEAGVLVALVLTALTFGYLAFSPASYVDEVKTGKAVATMNEVDSSVKRKPDGSLAWNDAESGGGLYGGDQILTAAHSQAHVQFAGGGEVTVAENSLIKFETAGGRTSLDMTKGFVSGKFTDAAGPVTIKIGKTEVRLGKGAEVQIKIDQKHPEASTFALLSGEASVKPSSGQKEVQLVSHQQLQMNSQTGTATVQEIAIRLLKPDGSTRLQAGAEGGVLFAWANKQEAASYTVEIALDNAFTQIAARRIVHADKLRLTTLPPGPYYWRVRAQASDGSPLTSADAAFQILPPPPVLVSLPAQAPTPVSPPAEAFPRTPTPSSAPLLAAAPVPPVPLPPPLEPALQSPASGAAVALTKNHNFVYFSWDDRPLTDAFTIVIASTPDFSHPLFTKSVTGSHFAWPRPKAGRYYWRVQANSGEASTVSQTRIITVREVEPLPPPQLKDRYFFRLPPRGPTSMLRSLIKTVLTTAVARAAEDQDTADAAPGDHVEIHWPPVRGATGYVSELAVDEQFKQIIVQRTSTDPAFYWPEASPGHYFLHVASLDAQRHRGPFCLPAEVLITQSKLRLPTPPPPSRPRPLPPPPSPPPAAPLPPVAVAAAPSPPKPTPATTIPRPKKPKREAMRGSSDISPSITTPSRSTQVELLAAYAPALISNSMISPNVSNSLAVATFNSYFFEGNLHLNRDYSLEASYQRMSVDLYKTQNADNGTTDQPVLSFRPQTITARLKGHWALGSGARAPQFEARAGYLYKTFYNYYAGSLTTFSLNESGAHHAAAGLGLRQPLTASQYAEVLVDAAKPIASSPAKVTGGSQISLQAWYALELQAPLSIGFGLRYNNASYAFTDADHGVQGSLNERSIAVFGALGWRL